MSIERKYPPMVGDTVIGPYLRGVDSICKVVSVSYTWDGETGFFEGTIGILPNGSSTVRTVDVKSVRVMFFDSDARARWGEEPDVVY